MTYITVRCTHILWMWNSSVNFTWLKPIAARKLQITREDEPCRRSRCALHAVWDALVPERRGNARAIRRQHRSRRAARAMSRQPWSIRRLRSSHTNQRFPGGNTCNTKTIRMTCIRSRLAKADTYTARGRTRDRHVYWPAWVDSPAVGQFAVHRRRTR